jgi:transposase-like protein
MQATVPAPIEQSTGTGISGLRVPRVDPRLEELVAALGAERGGVAYLEELRWPDGPLCPRCGSDRTGYLEARGKHYCRDCAYQFRVTAGTVLHDSHLSASKWLLAVGLILDSERGFPATRLQRILGGSYKSAWFVEHRIRAAIADALETSRPSFYLALGTGRSSSSVGNDPPAFDKPEQAPEEIGAGLRLIKSLAAGAYHRASDEHLGAYWAELNWRIAYSNDPNVFRKTVHALLERSPLPYDALVHAHLDRRA